jgi:catechol 2,3-dioxygenase-like lactoylglutathione lyase family enzyme
MFYFYHFAHTESGKENSMKPDGITNRIAMTIFALVLLSLYFTGCGVDEDEEEDMLPTSADQLEMDQPDGELVDQPDNGLTGQQPSEEEDMPPPPADQPDDMPPDPQPPEPDPPPPEPAPVFTPNKVNHIGIGVRDIAKSEEFYTKVLGLEVVHRGGNMIFVRLGESALELFRTQGRDELAVDQTIGIRHFSICVENLQEAYDALRAKGVEFYVTPDVDRPYAFFRDPDNVPIGITEDIMPPPAGHIADQPDGELPDQRPPDEDAVFRPIKLHHVGLGVRDFQKSIEFYTEMLELELIHKGEFMAHFRLGESALELIRTEGHDELATEPIIGFRHVSIGVDNLQESYEALKAKGVRFYITPGNWPCAFFKDPDNISIELNDFDL